MNCPGWTIGCEIGYGTGAAICVLAVNGCCGGRNGRIKPYVSAANSRCDFPDFAKCYLSRISKGKQLRAGNKEQTVLLRVRVALLFLIVAIITISSLLFIFYFVSRVIFLVVLWK